MDMDMDDKKTAQEKELDVLVDEITEDGNHDFAETVEQLGIMMGVAKRLSKIFFNTDDKDTVLEIYDRLDIANGDED